MPQLVPFYFINEVTYAFIILIFMIYVISKYVLPGKTMLFISRTFLKQI